MVGDVYSFPDSWIAGNTRGDQNTTNIERGVIFPYVKGAAVYHCPADRSTVKGGSGLRRFRSYSMQCYFNTVIPEFQTGKVDKYADLVSPGPAGVFVYIDENEESIEDGVFGIPRSPDTRWLNLPSDRHGRSANITYADGHASKMKWLWPKKFISFWAPAAGQQDLKDLKRLQEALPQSL